MTTNFWNRLLITLSFTAAVLMGVMPGQLLAYSPQQSTPQEQEDSQVQMQMSDYGDYGAVSFNGEVGYRNFRGSGTYGVFFTPCQRFKVTGEYLTQKLKYHFGSGGDTRRWVSQYAIGGEYQFLLNHSTFQSINLGAAYFHAFSHRLSTQHPTPLVTLERRIAGADGVLSFLGTTVSLWRCAFLTGEVNYDWVHHHSKFGSHRTTHGFGGTVSFAQQFATDFSLNLGAEFRRPFTAFLGSINWNRLFTRWGINIGIFGNITDGKRGAPNITTGGVQLGLSFGGKGTKCCRCSESASQDCYERAYCDVSQWASTPAVYVPVVLAIADGKKTVASPPLPPTPPPCTGPPTSTTISTTFIPVGTACGQPASVTRDLAPNFTSSEPLTYSFSTNNPLQAGNTITLDANTGFLTLTNLNQNDQLVQVTVTGTSRCGSTSQTFPVYFCVNEG